MEHSGTVYVHSLGRLQLALTSSNTPRIIANASLLKIFATYLSHPSPCIILCHLHGLSDHHPNKTMASVASSSNTSSARPSLPSARAPPHSVRAPLCSKYTSSFCPSFFCVFPFYSCPKHTTLKWGPLPETALGKEVLGADTGSGRVVGSLRSLMGLPGLIPLNCFWYFIL